MCGGGGGSNIYLFATIYTLPFSTKYMHIYPSLTSLFICFNLENVRRANLLTINPQFFTHPPPPPPGLLLSFPPPSPLPSQTGRTFVSAAFRHGRSRARRAHRRATGRAAQLWRFRHRRRHRGAAFARAAVGDGGRRR